MTNQEELPEPLEQARNVVLACRELLPVELEVADAERDRNSPGTIVSLAWPLGIIRDAINTSEVTNLFKARMHEEVIDETTGNLRGHVTMVPEVRFAIELAEPYNIFSEPIGPGIFDKSIAAQHEADHIMAFADDIMDMVTERSAVDPAAHQKAAAMQEELRSWVAAYDEHYDTPLLVYLQGWLQQADRHRIDDEPSEYEEVEAALARIPRLLARDPPSEERLEL